MSKDLQYILIDDSEFDLFLNQEFLQMAGAIELIISFDSAEGALQYIIKESGNLTPSIILLDIHMPVMNGFEFLERFELFPDFVKKKIKIFIVSSTLDQKDIEKAKLSPLVLNILPKPLNTEVLFQLIAYHTQFESNNDFYSSS